MSDVIDLCDSPSPVAAAAKAGRTNGNDNAGFADASAAAGRGAGRGTDDELAAVPAKRAKIVPGTVFPACGGSKKAGRAAEEDDDSDVEFVDPEDKDDENGGNALLNSPARARGTSTGRTGRPKDDRLYDSDDDADDAQNMVGNNGNGKKKSGANSKGNDADEDSDDELEVVGTTGTNALVDFPHSRENCLTHRFNKTAAGSSGSTNKKNVDHCANCYCYVCDVPAKDCTSWQTHCQASHGERRWREERERYKRIGIEAASAAPAQQPAAAAAVAAPARSNTNANTTNTHANRPDLPQYSIQALLEKLTVVHPVETTPPAPVYSSELRHYQKQSLAFMLEVERSSVHPSPLNATMADGTAIRGGWLCDQVGMGKSAVTLALVASNPMAAARVPTADTIQEQMGRYQKWKRTENDWRDTVRRDGMGRIVKPETRPKPPNTNVTLKATVILTSVSLLGQWEDECAKHLDGSLKVMVCHGSRGKKKAFRFFETDAEKIADVDIILSTSTKAWDFLFTSAFHFHRVVHDEGHLLGKSSSAITSVARAILGSKRWSVTATPCTSSITELRNQVVFLGQSYSSNILLGSIDSKRGFYDALDRLKNMMVRHTKSQRIGGDEALALPPSTTTTTMITMSDEERRECRNVSKAHLLQKYRSTGTTANAVSRALGMHKGWGSDSKIKALRQRLCELRRNEPGLRAVIFTQYTETHATIVDECEEDGFETFQFTGSSSATQRDRQIREFQNATSSRPAVFVITLKAGSVGITLTAASHCFLIEPALDPATEVQAAGRVHRLGQTKPVHVTKFVYSRSPEENILSLHNAIAAGRIKIVDNQIPPAAVRLLMS